MFTPHCLFSQSKQSRQELPQQNPVEQVLFTHFPLLLWRLCSLLSPSRSRLTRQTKPFTSTPGAKAAEGILGQHENSHAAKMLSHLDKYNPNIFVEDVESMAEVDI